MQPAGCRLDTPATLFTPAVMRLRSPQTVTPGRAGPVTVCPTDYSAYGLVTTYMVYITSGWQTLLAQPPAVP